jgi:hypothetical protein
MSTLNVDAMPTKQYSWIKLLLSILVVVGLGYAGFYGLLFFLNREPPISTTPLPPPGPDAVTVKAVLYLSSPTPQKINEDGFYLTSGEKIFMERGRLDPDPQTVVSILDNEEEKVSKMRGKVAFDVILDEKTGLVCLAKKCARLLSICSPRNDQQNCRSFPFSTQTTTGN